MVIVLTKKQKEKMCNKKKILKFNDNRKCLLNNEIILKSQERFKGEARKVYIEEICMIGLSSNGDKRLQIFD